MTTQNDSTTKNPHLGTLAFFLGLFGGIIGVIAASFSISGGNGGLLGLSGASMIMALGISAILFSVLGIVGGTRVKKDPKIAGYYMIIAAIGGLFCLSLNFILPFILLLIAGIVAIVYGHIGAVISSGGLGSSHYQIKVTTPGAWGGTVTTEGSYKTLSGTGSKTIEVNDPRVYLSVTVWKKDHSTENMLLEIIKNGNVIKSEETDFKHITVYTRI